MKIAVLAGDGIGVEVTSEAVRTLRAVGECFGIDFSFDHRLIGGAAINETGLPFPGVTQNACTESDAVLLGAVGDPRFDELQPNERPEIGLLQLRQALGGFANLRPTAAAPALIGSSPLRAELFHGTDLLIVRELLGGLYFGEPRGFTEDKTEAFNTMRYSSAEVERVAHIAFRAAQGRRKRVTSVDKANVLEVSRLWREVVARVANEYPGIELEHLYVDACAMHLVTNPSRFDVILTENMFGDILSDEAAVLTGSLGMLASATIGGKIDLYEPVHGSAPDIAGKNIANPLGAIASVAMMLRYTAKNEPAAASVDLAISNVLDAGYRTFDIATERDRLVSTSEMGELVVQNIVESIELNRSYHAV